MRLFHKNKKHKYPSQMNIKKRTKKLKQVFYNKVGYPLDVVKPKTFNEKLNWLKLFYRNDDMTRIVDKYEFKGYIKEKLGDGYTVPLLGAWDNIEDIDFDKLPDKFVLKCNAQSDGKFIKVVKDKQSLDIDALKEEMKDWLIPEKTLKTSFCWAYHNVPLKILAEEYIEQMDGQVYDYKFFCFQGEPKFIYVAIDHFPGQVSKISLFDLNWQKMNVKYGIHPNIDIQINKPENFDKMIEISKILSKDFPFVRVDFYEIKDKIYIGEMTFYPGGGYNIFSPMKWDYKIGSCLILPKASIKYCPPFFEKVKDKNRRIIKIWGKKILSYYKSFSRKKLTKELEYTNNVLKSATNNIKQVKSELKATKDELLDTRKELLDTKDALLDARNKLQNTQNELQVKENELQNAWNNLDSLKNDFANMQTEITKLKADLASRPKLRPGKMRLEERIEYLKYVFSRNAGYPLNLRKPQTFNEKINWLKLFYRNNDMTRIVDKYEFKNYIKEKLGDGYTASLLGAWDNVEDIDFASLPHKFVLKCNAQSDDKFVKIVENKDELDIDALKEEMQHWLIPEETLKTSFCWAYHNVPLRIIAEEYLEGPTGKLDDWKIFCFNGLPKLGYTNVRDEARLAFFDMDYNQLMIQYRNFDCSGNLPPKPKFYAEMLKIAEKLAKPFPFVRVDFYETKDKILLGEMTFYPGGGYGKYTPKDWDYKLGEWLDLSKINPEHLI